MLTKDDLLKCQKIYIVACGSAYHVGIVGKYIIEKMARIPVEVDLASEFRYRDPIIDKNTLMIIISQSGETADTLAALRAVSYTHLDVYKRQGDGYIKIKTASLGQYAVLEQLGDFIIGDVDFSGKIDTADALKILQSSVGKITFDKNVAYIADVDGDHAVRTSDALLVLQKSVGKIERFPVEKTA